MKSTASDNKKCYEYYIPSSDNLWKDSKIVEQFGAKTR